MTLACLRGRKFASKVRARFSLPAAFPCVSSLTSDPFRGSWRISVFSLLRPVLETTCKSSSEDRAILLTMLAGDEYSRARNDEQLARLRLQD